MVPVQVARVAQTPRALRAGDRGAEQVPHPGPALPVTRHATAGERTTVPPARPAGAIRAKRRTRASVHPETATERTLLLAALRRSPAPATPNAHPVATGDVALPQVLARRAGSPDVRTLGAVAVAAGETVREGVGRKDAQAIVAHDPRVRRAIVRADAATPLAVADTEAPPLVAMVPGAAVIGQTPRARRRDRGTARHAAPRPGAPPRGVRDRAALDRGPTLGAADRAEVMAQAATCTASSAR